VRLSVLFASLFLSVSASAQTFMFDDADDMDTETVEEWQASAEFGLLYTSGNTETESLKGKLNVSRDVQSWRHKGVIDYYTAEQEDQSTGESIETADRMFVSAQSNYKFSPDSRSSLFIFGSYEEDEFSGYEYQATVATGYGARYRYDEDLYADYEIGPGYSRTKPIQIEGEPPVESEGQMILRLAGSVDWKISENSKFNALLSSELGEDNTKSKAEVSLSSNINSSLAMKFSVSGTHNSNVSDESIEKLDTETAVTLVYTF
jgi:putative salt-induced outer membrane protein YdiY